MSDETDRPVFEYLLSGRNARGRTVTEIVEAESTDRAVQVFEDGGHTDIVLHTDDVFAPFYRPSEATPVLTPREQIAIRTMGEARYFLFWVWKGYRMLWHITLTALVMLGVWLAGWSLMGFEYLALFALLLVPALHLYRSLFGPAVGYKRLLRAIGHARWDLALALIPKVKLPRAPVELRLLKARALAGLDRLPDALAELDELTGDAEYLRRLYWLSQSIVYMDGGESEKSLEALAQGHELAPDLSLVTISYAARLLTVRWDARRARELLADARRHAVADSSWPLLLYAEGLLALQEGRAADAVERLTEAVRRQEPIMYMNPSVLIAGARMRANLCLALAATGDTAAARAELRRAAPLLAAHRESDLLKRCEQAVG